MQRSMSLKYEPSSEPHISVQHFLKMELEEFYSGYRNLNSGLSGYTIEEFLAVNGCNPAHPVCWRLALVEWFSGYRKLNNVVTFIT